MGVEGRDDDDKAREKAAFLTGRNGEMVKFNCIINLNTQIGKSNL